MAASGRLTRRELLAIVQYDTGELNYICESDTCSHCSWRDYRDAIGVPDSSEFAEVKLPFVSPWLPVGPDRMGEQPAFARLIDSGQLSDLKSRPSYLIPEILVEGQPCVIGGRSKAMKTSVAIDLAVSLGSGTDFLGQFPTKRRRVAVWSGESGASTIRDTACRIATARQINLVDCSIQWSFDLPRICRDDHLAWLTAVIIQNSIDVVILDPLYLSISNPSVANSASNLYAMGNVLAQVTTLVQQTGVTFIVLHHFRKSGQPDPNEPASLNELAQAGIGEWTRQWILLQRRSKYQCDGRHELWMRCGGSAGHAGLWAVDINEGRFVPGCETGRFWAVSVRTVGQVLAEKNATAEQCKIDKTRESELQDQQKVLEVLENNPCGVKRTMLRAPTGLSASRIDRAIYLLLTDDLIQPVNVRRHTRVEAGYALKPDEVLESETDSEAEDPEEMQEGPEDPSDAEGEPG